MDQYDPHFYCLLYVLCSKIYILYHTMTSTPLESGVGAKQHKIEHDGGIYNVVESTGMADFESEPIKYNEQLSTKGDESCSEGRGISVIGLTDEPDRDDRILQ